MHHPHALMALLQRVSSVCVHFWKLELTRCDTPKRPRIWLHGRIHVTGTIQEHMVTNLELSRQPQPGVGSIEVSTPAVDQHFSTHPLPSKSRFFVRMVVRIIGRRPYLAVGRKMAKMTRRVDPHAVHSVVIIVILPGTRRPELPSRLSPCPG